jgi:hypothetical protein
MLVNVTLDGNERILKQVKLVNFVLSEMSTSAKVVSNNILSFSSKDRVYHSDSTENVSSIRASTSEGNVEVRVTNINTENMVTYEKFKKLGLSTIRMFYEAVGRNYLQKVPSFSHSRLISYELGIDSGSKSADKLNKLVIEVEEDMGPEFPYEIMFQIEEYINSKNHLTFADELPTVPQSTLLDSQRMEKSKVYAANKSYLQNKSKGSLISFVWGSLLATYVKKLEVTSIHVPLKSDIFNEFRKKSTNFEPVFCENRQDTYDKTTLRVIENKLAHLFRNEVYSLFREEEVMTYAPNFIDIENLRIFRKDSQLNIEPREFDVYGNELVTFRRVCYARYWWAS